MLREGGHSDEIVMDLPELVDNRFVPRLKTWWGQGSVGDPECTEFMIEMV